MLAAKLNEVRPYFWMLTIITPAGINLPVNDHPRSFVRSGHAISSVLSTKRMQFNTKWNGCVSLEKGFETLIGCS
jgi:hypothetical protein